MQTKGFLWVLGGAVAECGWAYGLKHAQDAVGFALTAALVCVSFVSFIKALKYIPVSVAYTVFVGLGAFFVVIAEIVSEFRASGQTPDLLRLFFIATLIAGVLGLKRLKS
ncbi:DMT family transporter [Campylobacter concisus]|uniref:Guanidinium exporter n=1 Tax=Campylobacter concisus TaxID=199 RepID=A0AAE7P3V6_9BACT|nr:SMR family transporter [Campylobacter concisus]QPH87148.1 chaperonin [Campylobacter concisus]